jgi:hypothetical protein
MKMTAIKTLVENILEGHNCENSSKHCWRVAVEATQQQREDDAVLAEAAGYPELAAAIRGSV